MSSIKWIKKWLNQCSKVYKANHTNLTIITVLICWMVKFWYGTDQIFSNLKGPGHGGLDFARLYIVLLILFVECNLNLKISPDQEFTRRISNSGSSLSLHCKSQYGWHTVMDTQDKSLLCSLISNPSNLLQLAQRQWQGSVDKSNVTASGVFSVKRNKTWLVLLNYWNSNCICYFHVIVSGIIAILTAI